MGYSVYLTIETGAGEGVSAYDDNYTYNVSPMFYKAFGEIGLTNAIDGKSAGSCVAILDCAIARMEAGPDEYLPLNPPNGWGDYEGALEFLRDLRAACARHPLCIVSIS